LLERRLARQTLKHSTIRDCPTRREEPGGGTAERTMATPNGQVSAASAKR
jgi:hypothetical protein